MLLTKSRALCSNTSAPRPAFLDQRLGIACIQRRRSVAAALRLGLWYYYCGASDICLHSLGQPVCGQQRCDARQHLSVFAHRTVSGERPAEREAAEHEQFPLGSASERQQLLQGGRGISSALTTRGRLPRWRADSSVACTAALRAAASSASNGGGGSCLAGGAAAEMGGPGPRAVSRRASRPSAAPCAAGFNTARRLAPAGVSLGRSGGGRPLACNSCQPIPSDEPQPGCTAAVLDFL
jgi:hypothetical protein